MTTTNRRTARTLGLGLLATGAAALLFSSTAEASPYISSGSRAAASMSSFHRADLNGDGYLSASEMRYLPASVRVALSSADYNYDGYVSLAEARSVLVVSYTTPRRRYRVNYRYTRPHTRRHRYNRRRVITHRRGRVIKRGRATRRNRSSRTHKRGRH